MLNVRNVLILTESNAIVYGYEWERRKVRMIDDGSTFTIDGETHGLMQRICSLSRPS